jgi:hypothetical protein
VRRDRVLSPSHCDQRKVSYSEDRMPKCDNFYDSPVPNVSDNFSRNDHFNTSHYMNFPSRRSPEFYMNSQSFNNHFASHRVNHEPSFSHIRTRSLSPPYKTSYSPPVKLRVESNVPSCSRDVSCHNRI